MGSTASIPNLKKALSDKETSVALAAAHALDLMHDDFGYEVYYAVLTGERKGGKGLIAEQVNTFRDPKKLAGLGFSEGIGFVPFAGIGWNAFRAIRKNDSSPVRAAAASALANDTDPRSGEALANATGDKNWLERVPRPGAITKRQTTNQLVKVATSIA